MGMTVAVPFEHIDRAYAICALAAWLRNDRESAYTYASSRKVRAILHEDDEAVGLLRYVYSREVAEAANKEIDAMLNAPRRI